MSIELMINSHEKYVENMNQDGVIVLKQLIPAEKMIELQNAVLDIQSIILKKINHKSRPLKNYSDIAERQLGRLDFRCGFSANIFTDIAKPIVGIIKSLSPQITFKYYWGAIPALSDSGPTDMHRDIYPILNTTQGMNLGEFDLQLPPYYFTALIPLVAIRKENGPTEFIKGSHKQASVQESKAEIFAPLLNPGDVIIFDGRTMHRGSANHTQETRLIAYITFFANWYNDQTFALNNYLLPELGVQIY